MHPVYAGGMSEGGGSAQAGTGPWSVNAGQGGGSALPAERARSCARVGCGEPPIATLTADYDGRVMAVGPLSPVRMPPALDLCARHREALTPPEGWVLLAHDAEREG